MLIFVNDDLSFWRAERAVERLEILIDTVLVGRHEELFARINFVV